MADRWWAGYCREIAGEVNDVLMVEGKDEKFLTAWEVEQVLIAAGRKEDELGLVTVPHSQVYLTIPSPRGILQRVFGSS